MHKIRLPFPLLRALAWSVGVLPLLCGPLLCCNVAQADHFTYVDQTGTTLQIEARLVASGQGTHILELANGQYRLVPQSAVKKREVSDGPQPLGSGEVIAELAAQFGAE